jgi:anti-sigma factor RsiW
MRLFPHDDPIHREASELLPWFVNGTLESGARQRVAEHLQDCMACHQESLHLQRMQAAIQDDGEDLEASRGLQRLKARIGPVGSTPPPPSSPWRRWLKRWRLSDPWMRGALGVQLSGVMGLAMSLAWRAEPQAYHTLSAPPVAALPSNQTARIAIVLDAETTERAWRALMLSVHAQVIDGPTPEGSYVIALPLSGQDAALVQLRQHPAVRFAEPVASPAAKP